jgi:thiol-disulfide isomerase/thioredoxin
VLGKQSVFNFIVGYDQQFTLETSSEDYNKKMTVKGDDDNRLFFENLLFEQECHKEAEPFVKVLQDSTVKKEDQKKVARESFAEISKKVLTYQRSIVEKYPKTVTARLLNMNHPVQILDPPKKADGSIDSTFQFQYYRQHYFDNFGLGDEVMLRQQKIVYWDKVEDYLDKLFIQQPDSIAKAIDNLISVARNNQTTYKYLVWKCIVNYQNPDIMGLDQVYVHLIDKYIATGEMDFWLDKKTIQNLKEHANKLRRAPIGAIAPNLVMQNERLQPKSMYDLKNKYTILYFFKPSCGHCREETPKLVSFYNNNKNKFDFDVFAVSTDTALTEMKNFIKEMKTPWITVNGPRSYIKTHFMELYYAELTPTIYIIDRQKTIIARKLGVEQLEGFFNNYEKMGNMKNE